MAKVWRAVSKAGTPDEEVLWIFHCPGCEYGHHVRVKGPDSVPVWTWNDNPDSPTVSPSLLVSPNDPKWRCHSFIKDGRIQFLGDCFHKLANQTVDIPDVEP